MQGGLPGSEAYHIPPMVFKPFIPSEKKVTSPSLSDRRPRISLEPRGDPAQEPVSTS